MQDPLLNRQIGDFLIQDLLEQRVSISIYRATQQSLKRFVLFKVVDHKGVEDHPEELGEDLESYIHSVVGLEHLHLQPIYAYGVIDAEHIYIAGRFTSGTLYELLEAGALPNERALQFAKQIIEALAYIQAHGFIHRSLSPHNIYLDDAGDAYINDLELAAIIEDAESIEDLKKLLDEPFYVSVEQLECGHVDFRSEVYNFGAVIYHMVTGVPPFVDDDNRFETVLERKRRNKVVPPSRLNPAISPEMEALILRLIRANPAERFPDAGSVLDQFAHFERPVAEATAQSSIEKVKGWLRRWL